MDLTGHVTIEQRGRAGFIKAVVGSNLLSFEWEFGGTVIVIIFVPSLTRWESEDPWRHTNRGETLVALAVEVCRLKCPGCKYRIEDNFLEIYE